MGRGGAVGAEQALPGPAFWRWVGRPPEPSGSSLRGRTRCAVGPALLQCHAGQVDGRPGRLAGRALGCLGIGRPSRPRDRQRTRLPRVGGARCGLVRGRCCRGASLRRLATCLPPAGALDAGAPGRAGGGCAAIVWPMKRRAPGPLACMPPEAARERHASALRHLRVVHDMIACVEATLGALVGAATGGRASPSAFETWGSVGAWRGAPCGVHGLRRARASCRRAATSDGAVGLRPLRARGRRAVSSQAVAGYALCSRRAIRGRWPRSPAGRLVVGVASGAACAWPFRQAWDEEARLEPRRPCAACWPAGRYSGDWLGGPPSRAEARPGLAVAHMAGARCAPT